MAKVKDILLNIGYIEVENNCKGSISFPVAQRMKEQGFNGIQTKVFRRLGRD